MRPRREQRSKLKEGLDGVKAFGEAIFGLRR